MSHYQVEVSDSFWGDRTPERQLLASVLGRALMDLSAWDIETRAAALEWLNDGSERVFSFLWIAKQLDISECVASIREKSEQEFMQSMEYYDGKFPAEGRPRRERIFDLS